MMFRRTSTMFNRDTAAYSEGEAAARTAISNGVPRWIVTSERPFGESIDPATGLPIAFHSFPPELKERMESFAEGHNDAIRTAVESGAIDVDFRPLLMSRNEVVDALSKS